MFNMNKLTKYGLTLFGSFVLSSGLYEAQAQDSSKTQNLKQIVSEQKPLFVKGRIKKGGSVYNEDDKMCYITLENKNEIYSLYFEPNGFMICNLLREGDSLEIRLNRHRDGVLNFFLHYDNIIRINGKKFIKH